jgi:hypothetical protein
MQLVTGFPPDWEPTPFQQVAALRVSYERLRSAGLVFSNGEDELGSYEHAVMNVEGSPVVFQHYLDSDPDDFSLEIPREIAQNDGWASTMVNVVFSELGIHSELVTWRADNLTLHMDEDAEADAEVARRVAEATSSVAGLAARLAAQNYGAWPMVSEPVAITRVAKRDKAKEEK